MPKGLRRRYGLRHLHFITCSCYRRLPLFASVYAKNLFVKILGEVRDRYGFSLVAYVVMPEHIHLLVGEPATGTPSTAIQVLKQRASRRLQRKNRESSAQFHLNFSNAEGGAKNSLTGRGTKTPSGHTRSIRLFSSAVYIRESPFGVQSRSLCRSV